MCGVRTETLNSFVDPRVVQRGVALATQDAARIESVEAARGEGAKVSGYCTGSRGDEYFVTVDYTLGTDGVVAAFNSWCACPYGERCKHAVALALKHHRDYRGIDKREPLGAFGAFVDHLVEHTDSFRETREVLSEVLGWGRRRRPVRREPTWQELLEEYLPVESAESSAATPVAVVFETDFDVVGDHAVLRNLSVTGGRPRKNGRGWVSSDMTLAKLENGTGHPVAERDRDRLIEILSEAGSYDVHSQPQSLRSLRNPEFFALLDEAQGHGIELATAGGGLVILHEDPLTPTVHVTENDEGLRMHAAIVESGDHPPLILGHEARGAAWFDDDGYLNLGRFRHRAPVEWQRLREARRPITVPPEGRAEFEEKFLPRLRATGWSSPDESFVPTPPAPPVVRAFVTATAHLLRGAVEFCFAYSDGRTYALGTDADPTRNGESESELLAGLEGFDLTDREMIGAELMEFLHETLPQLEAAGVDARLSPGARELLGLEAAESIELHAGLEGQDKDWLDLSMEVRVDGQGVPLAEVIRALRSQARILIVNGHYAHLDSPQFDKFAQLLEEAQGLSDARRSAVRVPKTRVDWWDQLGELDALQVDERAWLDKVVAAAHTELPSFDVPAALDATLRPYQEDGFRWLASLRRRGFGGVLADDMGLGKTIQILSMILDSGAGPWLVVAPTSVVSNWKAEAAKFAPSLRVAVVDATSKRRQDSLESLAESADVLVTSYTLLRLEASEYQALGVAGVVLDEAQNVKNPTSKIYAAVRDLQAPVLYAVTGTPIENSLKDAWSQFSLAAPGLLGSFQQFRERFEKPIAGNDTELSKTRMAELRRRVEPFLLRRRKADVALDLPPIQEQVVPVELAPAHRKLYDVHLARERQRVLHLLTEDPESNRVEVLAALTRLRQLAISPTLVEPESTAPSSKLDAMTGLLRDILAEDHRVLIFSQFTSYLAEIRTRLEAEGVSFSYLDGGTRDRDTAIRAFTEGNTQVFLISLKAGGVGLNLTQADYVIVADPWWNPAAEAQAIDRAHRIGQTQPVTVYRLVSANTIEDKVVALQDTKRALSSAFLEPTGSATSGAALDAAAIRDLLA